MSHSKRKAKASVELALQLDGDVEKIKHYYQQWAQSYDADLADDYPAVQYIAALADDAIGRIIRPDGANRSSVRIVDAGCGTGLVGAALARRGYRRLDGFDISPDMVERAQARHCYDQLHGNVDLNQPLPATWNNHWEVTVCCGVFTLGHVASESIEHLVAITRPGGLIIVSTRAAFYAESNYQLVSDQLVAQGRIELLNCVRDAPYTNDSEAHYWVYQVCPKLPS